MKFGIGLVGGVRSGDVGFCIVFLLLVISSFDCLGGGVECVLVHSPSEVGMVTPSVGCVNCMLFGGVGSTGIIPGVFDLVTCCCVRGDKCICVGDFWWMMFGL